MRDLPVVRMALHDTGDLAAVAHPLQAGDQQAAQHKQAHRTPVGKEFVIPFRISKHVTKPYIA